MIPGTMCKKKVCWRRWHLILPKRTKQQFLEFFFCMDIPLKLSRFGWKEGGAVCCPGARFLNNDRGEPIPSARWWGGG